MKKIIFLIAILISVVANVANAQTVTYSDIHHGEGYTIVTVTHPGGRKEYIRLNEEVNVPTGYPYYQAVQVAHKREAQRQAEARAKANAELYGYGSYGNSGYYGGYYYGGGSTGNIIVDAISTGIGIANTVKAAKAERRARKAAEAARRPATTTRATASSSSRELHIRNNGDILFE